ncbi:membrane protein FxsA [Oleiphilus messinensis]|uniref:Membrane protein FxsA n=1 Tax=Oleiphilus messinensis TaxID=141451 RepID=A0A1Y0IG04_9GAMM|nr:FxsA family protein [Oleiphilus messinensis]ARU58304.1 membrane protein FxsA [Oleiphilus messinensis]
MKWFFLIFVIVPVLELSILIKLGSFIGVGWTILLILSTAIVGASLLRKQGVSTLLRANQRMANGEMPAREVAEGFFLALGGALLLTPGLLTDVLGFSLIVPTIRARLADRVIAHLSQQPNTFHSSFQHGGFSAGSNFSNGSPFSSRSPFSSGSHSNSQSPFEAGRRQTGTSASNAQGEVFEGEFSEVSDASSRPDETQQIDLRKDPAPGNDKKN